MDDMDLDRYRYRYLWSWQQELLLGLLWGPGSESRADKLNMLGNNCKTKQADNDLRGLFQPACG